MKKFVTLLLISVLCITGLFAYISIGVGVTGLKSGEKDYERLSFNFEGGGNILEIPQNEEKGFKFSLLTESVCGLSFDSPKGEPLTNDSLKVDITFALLPGVKFVFGKDSSVNLSAGIKYSRIGYRATMEQLEDVSWWDSAIQVVTIGVMGGNPSRELAAVADLRFTFGFLGFGVQGSYTLKRWQKFDNDMSPGFGIQAFVTLGFI